MNPLYRHTTFLTSAARLEQAPPDQGWEVAFAGRSNAGKSSAINALCGQKSLTRTSKTPGRTRLLNFFRVDDERRLVDLPGYGYAKVPKGVLDVALVVHFWEAWLATLAVAVWHLYSTVFHPNVYPMNPSWLTGRMPEEMYRHEHPEHLEEARQAGGDLILDIESA